MHGLYIHCLTHFSSKVPVRTETESAIALTDSGRVLLARRYLHDASAPRPETEQEAFQGERRVAAVGTKADSCASKRLWEVRFAYVV